MEEFKKKNEVKLRRRHPIMFWGCLMVEGLVVLASATIAMEEQGGFGTMLIVFNLLVIPAMLTFANISLIFVHPKEESGWKTRVRCFEVVSMLVGFVLSAILLRFLAQYDDWHTQISVVYNHFPIWTKSMPTFVGMCLIGIAGYLVLACTHAKRTPHGDMEGLSSHSGLVCDTDEKPSSIGSCVLQTHSSRYWKNVLRSGIKPSEIFMTTMGFRFPN